MTINHAQIQKDIIYVDQHTLLTLAKHSQHCHNYVSFIIYFSDFWLIYGIGCFSTLTLMLSAGLQRLSLASAIGSDSHIWTQFTSLECFSYLKPNVLKTYFPCILSFWIQFYIYMNAFMTEREKRESEVIQSCSTLCNLLDCSLPSSSIHGIFQARVLEWVVISFSRGSLWRMDRTWVSRIAGRCFNLWATREVYYWTLFK